VVKRLTAQGATRPKRFVGPVAAQAAKEGCGVVIDERLHRRGVALHLARRLSWGIGRQRGLRPRRARSSLCQVQSIGGGE
jgi:hypothetical protein